MLHFPSCEAGLLTTAALRFFSAQSDIKGVLVGHQRVVIIKVKEVPSADECLKTARNGTLLTVILVTASWRKLVPGFNFRVWAFLKTFERSDGAICNRPVEYGSVVDNHVRKIRGLNSPVVTYVYVRIKHGARVACGKHVPRMRVERNTRSAEVFMDQT